VETGAGVLEYTGLYILMAALFSKSITLLLAVETALGGTNNSSADAKSSVSIKASTNRLPLLRG